MAVTWPAILRPERRDPAARINTVGPSSQIGPGNILSRAEPRSPIGATAPTIRRSKAAAIQANTIDVNRIKIGARGLDIYGCQFQFTRTVGGALTNDVTWTAGTITYLADNGISTPVNISAVGTTMAIGGCIFWAERQQRLFV